MLYNRIKVNFFSYPTDIDAFNNKFVYNNRYQFYSALLNIIRSQDSKLAEDIHSNKIPRAFLFSNFIFSKLRKGNMNFHVYLSSRDGKVFNYLLKGLTKLNYFEINGIRAYKSNIQLEIYDVSNIDKFTFLSPFILRDKSGNTLETTDKFSKLIEGQIKRVADKLYKNNILKEKIEDFEVHLSSNNFKKKLFDIKGIKYRAWCANSSDDTISFEGDSKDLAKMIAFYCGIGDKTNFGFGMLGLPKGG